MDLSVVVVVLRSSTKRAAYAPYVRGSVLLLRNDGALS